MADPVLAVSQVQIPTAAYGGSAPITLPASAVLLWVHSLLNIGYVCYQHIVGDDTQADKFMTVTVLDEGVTTSPAAAPRPLGLIKDSHLGQNPGIAWEIFPDQV